MKIILSRKGFDGTNGGTPSPIMPDGTLLSMPIPDENDRYSYEDLQYDGKTYAEILKTLKPGKKYSNCHLDPDLDINRHINPIKNWKPAFGQIEKASSYLLNTVKVEPGDLFLFFGNYHRVKKFGENYWYVKNSGNFYDDNNIQLIWGYMQIGEIITNPQKQAELKWHPHSEQRRLEKKDNVIFTATDKLSFKTKLPGAGVFKYSDIRVLTLENKKMATWKGNDVYSPENIIGDRKNKADNLGIFYAGIWQELGLKETKEAEKWAKSLF